MVVARWWNGPTRQGEGKMAATGRWRREGESLQLVLGFRKKYEREEKISEYIELGLGFDLGCVLCKRK